MTEGDENELMSITVAGDLGEERKGNHLVLPMVCSKKR
jgi:hypothetical protein